MKAFLAATKTLGTPMAIRQAMLHLVPDSLFNAIKKLLGRSRSAVDLRAAALAPDAQALLEEIYHLGAFAAFGSLLGLTREGRFLPHDNDLDYIFVGPLAPLERALAARSAGRWQVARKGSHLLKIQLIGSPLRIDIFRGYEVRSRDIIATLACGKETALYHFPRSQIFPTMSVEYDIGKFLIPAEPKAFLAHHYGNTWTQYDPRWTYATAPSRVPTEQLVDLILD